MVRIAMYGKGGIGKSTMSSNLTAALTDQGQRVLQIGCDPKHDSTRLLLNGEVKSTILDYLRDTPFNERKLEDIVSPGYGGCLCAEAGGPEPGVGCAGRGIISSFDLLNDLGLDLVERDVTLYDVLGDVVCGGFAVPLRNEYAEMILIVSSGEFMSIYAANNILKGICNYDPDRVGGIIFNSRGDPEEKARIERFSEAVGIPIIASFDRSDLFMTAEENGKTVVEMYPDSTITQSFRELAAKVMRQEKHRSRYLGERELEGTILGRTIGSAKHSKRLEIAKDSESPRRRYVSRNVSNDEPYGGCAFSGANGTCSSIKGIAVILHAPLSCTQFTFQTISCTYGRYGCHHRPIESYSDPSVFTTRMTDSDMIFGGTPKLREQLERCVSSGYSRICVVTSCPSGIIGDDVKGTVSAFLGENPGVKIALIESDGNMNGDFMQGVIDAAMKISDTFAIDCGKTDTVNLIGSKSLALNCMSAMDVLKDLLGRIGVRVNCIFPAGDSIESVERIGSARLDIMSNPDVFTVQLCRYLQDRFSVPYSPVPVRPGIKGTLAWMTPVAEMFGKGAELNRLRTEIEAEFDEYLIPYRKVLEGKRFCIISASRDIDWILETTEAVGMVILRTAVVDRPDYYNDMSITNDYPDISLITINDMDSERSRVKELQPDMVISTLPTGLDVPHVTIPLVQEPGPYTGVEFIRRVAAIMLSSKKEGWRKDVL